jgi:phosphoribosylglycinamide formyltransferase-1
MASGSGSTFEALATGVYRGEIPAEYMLLVTDNPNAGALDRAERLGIEAVVVSQHDYDTAEEHDAALRDALLERNIGLAFLAGYMRQVGPRFLEAFEGRTLNTHPALLEDDPTIRRYGGHGMFGSHVDEAVFASHESVSGATVHLVDGQFDHGPVLRRAEVDISLARTPGEVATKVQEVEKPLVVSVLRDVLIGELKLPDRDGA